MSKTKYARARHLAAMLSDHHRFLAILTGADMQVTGSMDGHLGCCAVLEDISGALAEGIDRPCPDADNAYLRGYSDATKATAKKEVGDDPGA